MLSSRPRTAPRRQSRGRTECAPLPPPPDGAWTLPGALRPLPPPPVGLEHPPAHPSAAHYLPAGGTPPPPWHPPASLRLLMQPQPQQPQLRPPQPVGRRRWRYRTAHPGALPGHPGAPPPAPPAVHSAAQHAAADRRPAQQPRWLRLLLGAADPTAPPAPAAAAERQSPHHQVAPRRQPSRPLLLPQAGHAPEGQQLQQPPPGRRGRHAPGTERLPASPHAAPPPCPSAAHAPSPCTLAAPAQRQQRRPLPATLAPARPPPPPPGRPPASPTPPPPPGHASPPPQWLLLLRRLPSACLSSASQSCASYHPSPF
mmetsp:Transcript_1049/g.3196  ORF Transcript_1049/g.3196 Transcript_1049/m.3196 type:complete len:313 (-) Transcript_1049:4756-5694(-)